MANGLSLKDRFANFLFGTPVEGAQFDPRPSYGEEAQKYLDTIPTQAFVLNQPKETGLTPEQYQAGFMQGLNYGNTEWAKKQDELGIRKPQTGEEKYLASVGDFNQYPIAMGTSNDPRQGGLINDFMGGLRENYNEGLQAENLMPDQNKGWATRLGEGFGTALRFADKPIGRFALATGLSALTGEANPLAEGVTAYVGRQQNQTADKAYRQALAKMGYDQNEIDSIGGNITNDIFRSFVLQKQLQDNAEWRKMNIETQQEQNKIMNQQRQAQLEETRAQRAFDRMLAGQKLSIEERKLALDWYKTQKELELKDKPKIDVNQLSSISTQLQNFDNIFENVNNPYRFRVFEGASRKLNTLTPEESNFESQATLLFNKIARDLGGEKGVLSDQDIQNIKNGMPTLKDTTQQKRAKMSAIYSLLEIRLNEAGIPFNNPYDVYGNKVENAPAQTTGGTKVGKYTVRVK